jgi:hypothetical protein
VSDAVRHEGRQYGCFAFPASTGALRQGGELSRKLNDEPPTAEDIPCCDRRSARTGRAALTGASARASAGASRGGVGAASATRLAEGATPCCGCPAARARVADSDLGDRPPFSRRTTHGDLLFDNRAHPHFGCRSERSALSFHQESPAEFEVRGGASIIGPRCLWPHRNDRRQQADLGGRDADVRASDGSERSCRTWGEPLNANRRWHYSAVSAALPSCATKPKTQR